MVEQNPVDSGDRPQASYPGERIGGRTVTGVVPGQQASGGAHLELCAERRGAPWLADHDFFGLPKVRILLRRRASAGSSYTYSASAHHPYGGEDVTSDAMANVPVFVTAQLAYSTMAHAVRMGGIDAGLLFESCAAWTSTSSRCTAYTRAGGCMTPRSSLEPRRGLRATREGPRAWQHGVRYADARTFVAFGPIAMKGMGLACPSACQGYGATRHRTHLARGTRTRTATLTRVPGPSTSRRSVPVTAAAPHDCAFDNVGLVTQMDPRHVGRANCGSSLPSTRRSGSKPRLDADPYEDNDRSVELPETERERVLHGCGRGCARAQFWSVSTMKRTVPIPTWAIYTGRVGEEPERRAEGGPP